MWRRALNNVFVCINEHTSPGLEQFSELQILHRVGLWSSTSRRQKKGKAENEAWGFSKYDIWIGGFFLEKKHPYCGGIVYSTVRWLLIMFQREERLGMCTQALPERYSTHSADLSFQEPCIYHLKHQRPMGMGHHVKRFPTHHTNKAAVP